MEFISEQHCGLIFSIDDSWWYDAGMENFVAVKNHYDSSLIDATIVYLKDIESRSRLKGFNKRRLMRILKGFRNARSLPPIEVAELKTGNLYSYRLIDGFHRFHSSIAVGFTQIPVIFSARCNNLLSDLAKI